MDKQVIEISAEGDSHTDKVGFLEGLGCYLLWGVMPLYWKLLSAVPALEVLAWRMVWSCAFVLVLCVLGTSHEVPLPVPRSAGGAHVFGGRANHHVQLGRVRVGGHQRPRAGNEHRILPVPAVQHCLGPAGVQRAPDAHAESGHGAGRRRCRILHDGAWRSDMDCVCFGAHVRRVRRREEARRLSGPARHWRSRSLLTGVIGVAALLVGAVAPWIWQVAPPTPDPLAREGPSCRDGPARWLRIAHGRPAAVVRGCPPTACP